METYLRGNGFSGIAHAGTLRPPKKKGSGFKSECWLVLKV